MYSNKPDSICVENTNEKSGLPGIDQITAKLIQAENKTSMFLGPHTYSSHMKYSSTFPAVK
jgi:hypothetical protein